MFKFLRCLVHANKKQLALEYGFGARLEILDSFAAQDLTKDPSSTANVVLHFPHLKLRLNISWSLGFFGHVSVMNRNVFQNDKKIKSIRS